jgi:Uma2 family endonuclease
MAIIHLYDTSVQIPEWVKDLVSFRRWLHSDDFPEQGRICYLDQEVWIDLSREQFFSHNQVRTDFTALLGGLVRSGRVGRFVTAGMLLSSIEADFSSQPDGCFLSNEALDTGRVRLIEGKHGSIVELEGTPDMVLEIVSDSSVRKDTVTLKAAYAEAGIPEYWLVDVRNAKLSFDIFQLKPKGYVAVKKQAGWLKSSVFGKAFRLTRTDDTRGDPVYTLEVR